MARGRPSRATVYARLDTAVAELRDRLGGLPTPAESVSVWSDIWHQEAHHSTALEGNTLALREVEQLLDSGRAVGSKPLREYMEVKGYADAAQWVYAQALDPGDWHDGGLIAVQEVRHVHHLTMTPIWSIDPNAEATEREGPGQFREHDIRPFAEGMTPPTWPLVASMLAGWVDDVRRAAMDEDLEEPLPEALARWHAAFERIHPFLDGNGRVGRLLLNLMLVRLGYPPVVILKRQRNSYLRGLQRADAGDPGHLGEILARAIYDNLNRFIVPAVAGPARMLPLAALVDDEFTAAALRQAAQRGRLDAFQGPDGVWRSSRSAVMQYRASRMRRPRHE
jgi:hypothetical protein